MRVLFSFLALVLISKTAFALEVQKVTDDVYALIGEKKQRSASNLANNATFGVVLTKDGIVLMDPGGSFKGAQVIHETIKTITDKPVKIVVNTGGQDHRWLGNSYWKAQGAQIIASNAAVEDHKERESMHFTALRNFLGSGLDGTEAVYADTTFDDFHTFSLGGMSFEIHHKGQAHTPGDSFVWLKEKNTLFSGDIIYVERILGIGGMSHSGSWIEVFEALAEFNPKHIIPGHGHATTLEKAKADTHAYLLNIRNKMRAHIDDGHDIMTAPKIDQSAFSYLEQFSSLAGRNAQQVFTEMEWE
ncbi:MBL fold metallo-hydrolase [Terasakiella sp. SH-1]|uniref:MBL fold metallo-hydrolase n=1 Tax=Terasakiella sp. SH-1 TaxID=2560057 RepID=UPI001431DBE6|nr:MBL fold metallo-hydrolase [Terasakiella sp. SH-1]